MGNVKVANGHAPPISDVLNGGKSAPVCAFGRWARSVNHRASEKKHPALLFIVNSAEGWRAEGTAGHCCSVYWPYNFILTLLGNLAVLVAHEKWTFVTIGGTAAPRWAFQSAQVSHAKSHPNSKPHLYICQTMYHVGDPIILCSVGRNVF